MASDEIPSLTGGHPDRPGLRRVAAGSVAWQGLSYVSGKVMVLVSTIMLARILSQSDFGLVALGLVFITYADILTDLGAAEALVFLEAREDYIDGALTISLLWSAALTGAAWLTAPAVAAFFKTPEVIPIFRVLSISLFLGGTAEVPDALLRKNLLFRKRLVADLSRGVGQGAISIVLALAGFREWSIVWGYVAGDLLWSVTAWSMVSYRPSLRFWRLRSATVRPLLAFGLPAVGSAFLLVVVFNIDYLIVGHRLGTGPLGTYTIAFRIPQTIIIYVFYVLSTVAFPMFSVARKDPGRLERGYLTSIRLQSTYGAAAGIGLAMIAPMFVPVVLGDKWVPGAIVPLEGIALYAVFRAFGTGAGDVYKAIGRPRLSLWLAMVRLAILAPTLWLVADPHVFAINGVACAQAINRVACGHAINRVAWAQAVVAFLMAVLMQSVASRVIHVPIRRLLGAFRPGLAIGSGVAIGAGAVRLWIPLSNSDPIKLLLAIALGAVLGLGAVWVADRRFVREAMSLLRTRASGKGL